MLNQSIDDNDRNNAFKTANQSNNDGEDGVKSTFLNAAVSPLHVGDPRPRQQKVVAEVRLSMISK